MIRLRIEQSERIFAPERYFPACHASTLVQLPDGDVVTAWFAGTKEGAADVDIWLSIRHGGKWCAPRKVIHVPGVPTWNPVLFIPEPTGGSPPRMLLYYRVGKQITTWQSFVTESMDGGHTWAEPQSLPDGCLGPIKNKPIVLEDGTWLAGSSVETENEWFCQIERSTDAGDSWTVSTPLKLEGHPKGIIQPTLWESRAGVVHALMRGRGTGRIARCDSTDGGRTWNTPYLTDLPSNNSGIDLAKLPLQEGASLALAFNPVGHMGEQNRTPLVIALSFDNGETWPDQLIIEEAPGEYSYPAIMPTADGEGIAMTYTHNRKHIQYVRCVLDGVS